MKPTELNYYRKKQDVLFSKDYFKIMGLKRNLRARYKTIKRDGHINYTEAILIYYFRRERKVNMGDFNEKRFLP